MDLTYLEKHKSLLEHEFNLNGFASLPSFVEADQLSQIRNELKRYIQEVVPTQPKEQVYYEDPADVSTLKQIQRMFLHDDYFKSLMIDSPWQRLAEICLGEEVEPINMQFFNKPPGIGKPTPPHQDGYYFHLRPNHAITMWMALEDVECDQGCINYVQGSNHYGMRAHGQTGTLGFSQGISDFGDATTDQKNAVTFPCKAGHMIAHHSLTIHWADGNTSKDRTRQALGFIYYAKSAKLDDKAAAEYQKRLDDQLRSEGKI